MTTTIFPDRVKLWYCPACGKQVRGSYDIDETRSKCAGRIHTARVLGREYVLVGPDEPDSEAAVRL